MPRWLVQSAWIIPMVGLPIRDAAIVFGDHIHNIGRADALRHAHPDAVVLDLGDSCILPALVNAHAHLELSDRSAGAPPASFTQWLAGLAPRAGGDNSGGRQAAMEIGLRQSLRGGVATIGDITTRPARPYPFSADDASPEALMRIVSFGEVRAMAARRNLLEERLAAAADAARGTTRITVGISPHAPYSIDRHGYERCLEVARARQMPLTTHLAESPDEAEFLADHRGPFRDLWERIGGWDDSAPRFGGGPIRYARSIGLLDYPTLLAHVNYADDDELEILARGRASVAYCPRTHAYFGHPPHRWKEMLARGINVCLGTDGCASSPDLNLLADLRLVYRQSPETPATVLWEMATIRGARALGVESTTGSLSVGKSADFLSFPTPEGKPLIGLLRSDVSPAHLWIGGKQAF